MRRRGVDHAAFDRLFEEFATTLEAELDFEAEAATAGLIWLTPLLERTAERPPMANFSRCGCPLAMAVAPLELEDLRSAGLEHVDPDVAELLGREGGLLGGKGGSMHFTSVEHGMMGSYAIIGAHLPIANGAAWSAQMRGTGQVAVCFFGDGTTNIGAFHEALNLAAVWNLPVVFVCENNLYMEYTPIDLVTPVEHPAADRAAAYGLEQIVVDDEIAETLAASCQCHPSDCGCWTE